MNQDIHLERRLNLLEERFDKMSELLILFCKMSTQTNPSNHALANQRVVLQRLASDLVKLQRKG